MSIYYFGELVGAYEPANKNTLQKTSEPTLVGDIIKSRDDYTIYAPKQKTAFVVRHYQDA